MMCAISKMKMRVALVLMVGISFSCAQRTSQTMEDEEPSVVEQGNDFARVDERSDCLGNLSPPAQRYLQETAFSSQLSHNEVQDLARQRLRDRICQGISCGFVEQHITIWDNKQSGGLRCTMAVIDRQYLAEWRERVETAVSQRFEDKALELVQLLRAGEESPRLTIGTVVDHGVPGGLRAEWLHRHLQRALHRANAFVVPLPPTWAGLGIPQGVDGLVFAEIFPVGGTENLLEVSWEVRQGEFVRPGESVRIPESIAPRIDKSTMMSSLDVKSDDVGLYITNTRDGGGLCHGQSFQLLVELKQEMYVRVLNITDSENGTVIFPAFDEEDKPLRGGVPISLGDYEAVDVGGKGISRFIVIASPTREGLGRFASADRFCRLPETMVANLHKGEGLPAGEQVHVAATGYRFVEDESCETEAADGERIRMLEDVLATVPGCW